MQNTLVAVDLAKAVFEVAVSQEAGKVSKRLRLSRAKFGARGYRPLHPIVIPRPRALE